MELRPEEDNPQDQRYYADTISVATHVLNKTKLKPHRLQGQADRRAAVRIFVHSFGRFLDPLSCSPQWQGSACAFLEHLLVPRRECIRAVALHVNRPDHPSQLRIENGHNDF